MFKNFIITGLRNLLKNKLFSFVNVFGLSLSLAVCLLIISILLDQYSFDKFHPDPDRTYRINTVAIRKGGGTESYASSPYQLAAAIRAEHPFVTNSVRLQRDLNGPMTADERKLPVSGFFTEPSFFEIFGFTLSEGDPGALSDPTSLIVSEETAARFFGQTDPIGKSVSIEPFGEFQIRGVIKKTDAKTHIQFDLLGSAEFLKTWNGGRALAHDTWKDYYRTYTYVTLAAGTPAGELQAVLDAIPDRIYKGMELESRDAGYRFEVEPLNEITPGQILSNSLGSGLPLAVLIFLSVLAGIGMFAAAFNYANLTLARSTTRAKEVGIRKVSGATRGHLIAQFMGESVIVSLVSLVVAETILRVFLIPAFRSLSFTAGMDIRFEPSWEAYGWFIVFTLAIGLLAGLIPALILSSFKPAVVVKDVSRIRFASGLTLRKGIMVLQFAMTMVLLIVLTTVYRQSEFAAKMDYYGFDWQNTINVDLSGPKAHIIAEEMARYPGVESFSFASHAMGTWADSKVDVQTDPTKEPIGIRDYSVDERFVRNMKLQIVAGEGFHHRAGAADQILVNEKFVQWMQLHDNSEAIGKTIFLEKNTPVSISGVVKDFVFKPVTYDLEPMILRYDPSSWSIVHFKLKGPDSKAAAKFFESVWKKFNPSTELSWRVYGDELTSVYSLMTDLGRMVGLLSVLVLTISVLGLLGVVSYSVETRTREIGIRKVMGATSWNLVRLLSRQYVLLIVAAAAVGLPLSLFIADKMLSMFAYRTEFGVTLALPGVIIIIVTVALTIGSQAINGAHRNPVHALRQE